ncbi:unnamed protein product [Calypogeia fissa]
MEWMQTQVAEEANAPPGFSTVIVAKSRAGTKVKPSPMASSFVKGTVGASAEDKDTPMVKLKTITKPNPKPKSDQPGVDIPMTTTNQPGVDMTTPTQVEEPQE